jgi:hypothetical protein
MTLPKLTIKLSHELREQIEQRRLALGLTLSEFARLALSEKCGVEIPVVHHGWVKGKKRKH